MRCDWIDCGQSRECRAVLMNADTRGLLGDAPDAATAAPCEPDDAELPAALSDLAPDGGGARGGARD